MSEKRKRCEVLSFEGRIKVIRESENGLSQRRLAEKFNCGKTQIFKIILQKSILEEWESNGNKDSKRKRKQPNEQINKLVWEWFQTAKVRAFAEKLGISPFCASDEWLESFRKRHNIVYRTLCGESDDVNQFNVEDWKQHVLSMIDGYDFRHVYNTDETGLFSCHSG
ncbi:jerky protein homolog-like [Centruroides vittatus]|uniref:jerky protein homolog-like n=1 Tax=Centruroides vittatus TaxID=120091 RepID=UPI00350F4A8E